MSKPCYLILVSLLLLVFGCNNKDDATNNPSDSSVVGVWLSGDDFLSLSPDGFCSLYIDGNFIDSGTYTKTGSNISCRNNYFNRNTTYEISTINESTICVDISYVDFKGVSKIAKKTFTKSDMSPTSSSNILMDKTYTMNTTYAGLVSYNFSTNKSGLATGTTDAARPYPLRIFYIVLGNKAYIRFFTSDNGGNAIPSSLWTAQATRGLIYTYDVTLDNTGGIVNMTLE